jgi:hypothetical protein
MLSDQRKTMTLLSGRVLTNTLDTAGRVGSITGVKAGKAGRRMRRGSGMRQRRNEAVAVWECDVRDAERERPGAVDGHQTGKAVGNLREETQDYTYDTYAQGALFLGLKHADARQE